MKILFFALTHLLTLSSCFSSDLYYLSEDVDLLPEKASITVDSVKLNFSCAPYHGFVIKQVIVVEDENAVQISGIMLEKDWPMVPIVFKIGKSWIINIEKDKIINGKGTILIRNLTDEDIKLLKKSYP